MQGHSRVLLPGVGVLLAANAQPAVPWPGGTAPTPTALREQIADAVELSTRERLDEFGATRVLLEEREVNLFSLELLDTADLELIFLIGDTFFSVEHRAEGGLGGLIAGPPLQRVHRGTTGGLDTFSCAGCHSVGGFDGAGSFTQNAFLLGDGDRISTATARNPPALLGLGLVQALAVEMSAELAEARTGALAKAQSQGSAVEVPLSAKGVSFGSLLALPDGTVDTHKVSGVSADLVIRPFGWKGDVARLRRFAEEAARLHFGVQSTVLEARAAEDPARIGTGPVWDPDGDGVSREIEEGTISMAAAYLAMLETPVMLPPHDPGLQARWARGDVLFEQVGCSGCHLRHLNLADRIWEEQSDTPGGPSIRLNLLRDGDAPRGTDDVALFSDLKRHDMGPALADRGEHPDGIARGEFLTRSLWGVAESAPYLHDGRATTLPDAILAHGGEASAARDGFAALSAEDQANLHLFLLSMTRNPKLRVPR